MKNNLKDIFDTHYLALYNYANSIIKDKHTAEDLVQSVFIQLWENQKLLNLKEPGPFLMRCVRNKCFDLLRKPARKNEVFMDELPDLVNGNNASQRDLKEEDILSTLHYFASMLPPQMQKVFLMSRKQNMTYKEIAAQLNVSIKTVESQMGVALKKLRILLAKHDYLPVLLNTRYSP